MNIDHKGAVRKESPFAAFINSEYGVIGRTVSTKSEPNTSSTFQFWVADREEKVTLEIGNIVAAQADLGTDLTFGTVIEMRSYSDVQSFIADYLSHDFGNAQIMLPTDVSEVIVVTCAVMRNLSNQTKPVERSRVYFPSPIGIQFAYGIVNERCETIYAGAPIPLGVCQNGDGTVAPISVDECFLIGPEGAHLNVSGISGLATKTSAIQFVLKSLLAHTKRRVAVVMFNVKSRDLLYVDQPNPRLQENSESFDAWSLAAYNALGISPSPFEAVRFFAPTNPKRPGEAHSLRKLKVEPFEWDLTMIYRDIPTLFNSFDWDDKMETVWYIIEQEIEQKRLVTYEQMYRWVRDEINKADATKGRDNQWMKSGTHIATWRKMLGHLGRFPRSYRGLIAKGGTGTNIPWHELTNRSVFVIDLQTLGDRGQRLVFGRCMRALTELLEGSSSGSAEHDAGLAVGDQGSAEGDLGWAEGDAAATAADVQPAAANTRLDAIIVFVDELNKFAPSGNTRTPLKERLIDITARGRGLGLVLFGAEQFASAVDNEIVENSSTYLFGRTGSTELRSPHYAGLSDEVKAKITMLAQGRLLAKSAKFSQPIFLRFPYPPCLPGDQYGEEPLEAFEVY